MSRTLSQFLRDDYINFRDQLVSIWAVDGQQLKRLEDELKPIHKRYLALACIATIVGYRAKRSEYLEGVVEASYLCLVLSVKGLENPACVLLRQSIELVLKHIYFSSHPVEYEWACTREDYRDLTFQKLIEYLGRTKECQNFKGDICVKLNEWFGVLSRHVHVHSGSFMGYSTIGSTYQPKREIIKKLSERTKEIWPLLTAILIVHFTRRYFKTNIIEQQLIKSTLPRKLRNQVDKYLSEVSI